MSHLRECLFVFSSFASKHFADKKKTETIYSEKRFWFPHQIGQVVLVDDLCSCKHGQNTSSHHPKVPRPRHTSWHLYRLMRSDSAWRRDETDKKKKE